MSAWTIKWQICARFYLSATIECGARLRIRGYKVGVVRCYGDYSVDLQFPELQRVESLQSRNPYRSGHGEEGFARKMSEDRRIVGMQDDAIGGVFVKSRDDSARKCRVRLAPFTRNGSVDMSVVLVEGSACHPRLIARSRREEAIGHGSHGRSVQRMCDDRIDHRNARYDCPRSIFSSLPRIGHDRPTKRRPRQWLNPVRECSSRFCLWSRRRHRYSNTQGAQLVQRMIRNLKRAERGRLVIWHTADDKVFFGTMESLRLFVAAK